jgi:hypothetical protein
VGDARRRADVRTVRGAALLGYGAVLRSMRVSGDDVTIVAGSHTATVDVR